MLKLYKIILSAFLMTSIIAPLFARNDSKSKEKITHYVNTEKKYSIDFPVSWQPMDDFDNTKDSPDLYLSSFSGNILFSLSVSKNEWWSTLEDLIEEYLIVSEEPGREIITGYQVINGLEIGWIEFALTDPDPTEEDFRMREYFCITDTMMFKFYFISNDEDFTKQLPKFEKVINSFRIL